MSIEKSIRINEGHNIHKKTFGKSIIIAGAAGYLGAAIIASKAALKTGSRYIMLMTTKDHSNIFSTYQPEIITSTVLKYGELGKFKNILIGPGLSEDLWSQRIFKKVIRYLDQKDSMQNIVADAGFLGLLAKNKFRYDNWILTPHEGEAAKLLETSSKIVNSDREYAAKEIQRIYGGIIILKGHKTIVRTSNSAYFCSHGNSGMATAGMGDCLAGIILSLLTTSNKSNYVNSILYAVGIHSLAADLIKDETGTIGLIATDVIEKINKLLNTFNVK